MMHGYLCISQNYVMISQHYMWIVQLNKPINYFPKTCNHVYTDRHPSKTVLYIINQVRGYHRDRLGCVDTVLTTDTQKLAQEWAATAAAAAAECLPRPELINIPVINVQQDFSSVQSLSDGGGDCYCQCNCVLVCRNYSVIDR